MRLVTAGESSFRFVVTVTLAEVFGGCIAYWMITAWDGVKPLLFAIGWGAGWGAMVGLILILQARLYSLDNLERERLRGESYKTQLEYLDAKQAADNGVRRFAVEVGASTTFGALTGEDVRYLQEMIAKGVKPSARNYPRFRAWAELERLRFVRYSGKRGAGREWTQTGLDALTH